MKPFYKFEIALLVFLSIVLYSPLCPAPTASDSGSSVEEPPFQGLNCPQICFMKQYLCVGERMALHLNKLTITTQDYNDTVNIYRDCNQIRSTCMLTCFSETNPETHSVVQ